VHTTCVAFCEGICSSSWSATMETCVPGFSSWAQQGTRAAPGETTCLRPAVEGIHTGHTCVYILLTGLHPDEGRPPSLLSWTGG